MPDQDIDKLNEAITTLQLIVRSKITNNLAIAHSFRIEDGVVISSKEQKAEFKKNMSVIRAIKAVIVILEREIE